MGQKTFGKTFRMLNPGPATPWEPTEYFVGDLKQGGFIYHIELDANNVQHCLVVGLEDFRTPDLNSKYITWQPQASEVITSGAWASGIGAGANNTELAMALFLGFPYNLPAPNQSTVCNTNAPYACANYSYTQDGVKFADWYLPSIAELILMTPQDANIPGFPSELQNYHSSTESRVLLGGDGKNGNIYTRSFFFDTTGDLGKHHTRFVRPVRYFRNQL